MDSLKSNFRKMFHSGPSGNDIDAVSTECKIINNTGKELKYVLHHDWMGRLGYPRHLPATRTSSDPLFVHIGALSEKEAIGGSVAAVVYRVENADGVKSDWCIAWKNKENGKNKVWTDIQHSGYFSDNLVWQNAEFEESVSTVSNKKLTGRVEINNSKDSATVTATIILGD